MVRLSVFKCLCALNRLHFTREAVPEQEGVEEKLLT